MPTVIAIIGAQEPSDIQLQALDRAIEWIRTEHPDATVASGCAKGIDERALRAARRAGLATIGYVPWWTYNPEVQAVCDRVICLTDVDPVDALRAYASLDHYHPAPRALTGGMPQLHARNFLIIRGTQQTPPAERVIAFPSNKRGGGGTGQGIRIAEGTQTACWVIDSAGEKVNPTNYRKTRSKELCPGETKQRNNAEPPRRLSGSQYRNRPPIADRNHKW